MRVESPLYFYSTASQKIPDNFSALVQNPQDILDQKREFTAVDSGRAVNNLSKIFARNWVEVWRPSKPFTDACAICVSDMPEEATSDIHVLMNYLKDEDPCFRWFAAGEMGSIGAESKDVQDPLIGIVEDEEELLFVRLAAIESLGAVRSAIAVPVLMKIMLDDTQNLHLVLGAMDALGNIGDAANGAIPAVIYIKEAHNDPVVTLSVIGTLEEIGSEEAVQEIMKIADDGSEEDFVREVAREALEE